MSHTNVAILDTETTGTDHEEDQVIELAHIGLPPTPAEFMVCESMELPWFHQRYLPSVPIKLGAQAVHNIVLSDLAGCPPADTLKIDDHGIDLMIGHNVDFDWRMLGEPEVARICTLALSRFLFPDADSHTQSAMLYMIARRQDREADMRERLKNAHAALDDIRNCAVLLKFLLREAAKAGHDVSTWQAVYELSQTARIPTIMGFGKHKGTPIERGQLDPSYVSWYRRQPETDPYYIEAFKRAGF